MDSCKFVCIELPDTYGISRSLLLSKKYFEKNKDRGIPVDITGSNFLLPKSKAYKGLTIDKGFQDGYFYPDLTTFQYHHLEPDTAFVLGDFRYKPNDPTSDHVISCPRGVLSNALQKLESLGFKIYGAFEYEFYLYKGTESKELAEISDTRTFMKTSAVKTYMSFTKDVMQTMEKYGLSPECHKIEYGIGQFEITMSPTCGIQIADNAMRFREIVKEVAKKHGYFATFVSMPYQDSINSSGHLNHSIWSKEGENLFYDINADDNLSVLSKQWLAGLQHHAKGLTCLSASTINCYSRLNGMCTPKNDSWGIDNRLACFRVKNFDKDRTYFENRIPGAATNPYLALAALIYAGLDGIESKLELKSSCYLGDSTKDDGSENFKRLSKLPSNLREGIENLKNDEIMSKNIGENFLNCFIKLRESELEEYEIAEKSGEEWAWQVDNYLAHF